MGSRNFGIITFLTSHRTLYLHCSIIAHFSDITTALCTHNSYIGNVSDITTLYMYFFGNVCFICIRQDTMYSVLLRVCVLCRGGGGGGGGGGACAPQFLPHTLVTSHPCSNMFEFLRHCSYCFISSWHLHMHQPVM